MGSFPLPGDLHRRAGQETGGKGDHRRLLPSRPPQLGGGVAATEPGDRDRQTGDRLERKGEEDEEAIRIGMD